MDNQACTKHCEQDLCNCHPVHLAAQKGNSKALETILTNDPFTLELRDDIDCTPPHCAIGADHAECVKFLLENGADVMTKGGRCSGRGGAIDDNDAVTMAIVLGST
jgi:ankyrin repeat protein